MIFLIEFLQPVQLPYMTQNLTYWWDQDQRNQIQFQLEISSHILKVPVQKFKSNNSRN